MEINIRPMRLADLDQIMVIEPAAFGSNHWSRQAFLDELNNPRGHYFSAEAAGGGSGVVGYSGFWLIGDEAHITTLAVDPGARRQHIGERLLLADIACAEQVGAKWLTLEVRASNQVALNLYAKYGFKSLGTRTRYYQDNDEDALVLWAESISSPVFQLNLAARRADVARSIAPTVDLSQS
jgi:[ribosomal protein S18]-alanine N-acetyltransferase